MPAWHVLCLGIAKNFSASRAFVEGHMAKIDRCASGLFKIVISSWGRNEICHPHQKWFSTFCSDIIMNNPELFTIRGRYHQTTKRISLDYHNSSSNTVHSLYVGYFAVIQKFIQATWICLRSYYMKHIKNLILVHLMDNLLYCKK